MEDYKPNSHRFKEEQKIASTEKKVEKVVKGAVKTRKKNELRRFADGIISEDAGKVKSYIFMDVLLPAFKKLVSDIVTDGIDMILYGETGRSKKSSSSSNGSHYVSYSSYSSRDRDRERYSTERRRGGFDLDEIIFSSRRDAEDVLTRMEEILDRYPAVTVNDLYEMVDLVAPHTASRYGWTNISSAEVVPVRGGGYVIKFPRVMPLD